MLSGLFGRNRGRVNQYKYFSMNKIFTDKRKHMKSHFCSIVKRIAFIAATFSVAMACSDNGLDPQRGDDKKYSISVETGENNLEDVLPTRNLFEITVTASDEWDYTLINSTDNSQWLACLVEKKIGGGQKFDLCVQENTSSSARSAIIRFTCGDKSADLKVKQKSGDTIIVPSYAFEVSAGGNDVEFEVISKLKYTYTINNDWIVEKDQETWSGNIVCFTVLENNRATDREGSITFKNSISEGNVKFIQKKGLPTLSLQQAIYNIDSNGGELVIDVTTNLQINMQIIEGSDWVRQSTTKAITPTEFKFTVDKNETGMERTARISFTAKEEGLSLTASINQSK